RALATVGKRDAKLASNAIYRTDILSSLGEIANDQGDLAAARAYFRRALTALEKDPFLLLAQISTLENLAVLEENTGDLEAAEGYLRRASNLLDKQLPTSATAGVDE